MHAPELHWLPSAGPDWSAAVQALTQPDQAAWAVLVGLAGARLDGLKTVRLDRRLQTLFPAPPPWLSTNPVRLALLGSGTLEHLIPTLRIGALRRGLWLDVRVGDYGQYASALDEGSELRAWRPDIALFAFDAPHLTAGFGPHLSPATVRDRLVRAEAAINQAWSAGKAAGCGVIQQTILPTLSPLLGQNEHRLPGSPAAAIAHLNERLRVMADQAGVDLVAVDTQAAKDGIDAWHDPMLWHRAKQDVHPLAGPVYGDLVGRLVAARQGRSSKALVLDLDNTLWGGVIGDDGMNGIVLGQGSALGEAYVAFQAYAAALARRGVILAVCSKNDEANALEPFDKHPEMVLKRGDIACFAANWNDKATNLRDIAQRLNIGLDSLVFVDDNPAERAIVRRELPMVAVPELPEDPALYASCIAAGGWFEAVRLTNEDLERSSQYQANLQRDAMRASVTDMEGYLRSLDMELRWSRFDHIGLGRITQLVNKTNQFNLTTRRTTEAEVAALIADPRALTLQIRLLDQFGDNGIIAIVHGHLDDTDLVIDTWLMSCRVLGRGVEAATLGLIASEAARLGASRLAGEYRPTTKNGMVRDHYEKLGFGLLDARPDGTTRWILPLPAPIGPPAFMRIVEV
jgi:FkbH-like protein